jgi:hypothetical protein
MKKLFFILLLLVAFTLFSTEVMAQCSICTRTAEQLGEKPSKGLNSGILYLLVIPLAIIGTLSYRTWKSHKESE